MKLMLQSKLFGRASKTSPQDEVSQNAELLTRAGFVEKLMAGVYSFLPLGLRVLNKINNIVREEMNALGAQEVLLPALQPKELWKETGRWDNPGRQVMFQFKSREGKEYGLGWTHEEVIVDLARRRISSYKDLPFYLYQIQNKFRDELRPKSGLLRGREFSMKDLYSFHAAEEDLSEFYERMKAVYQKIFERCGLETLVTEASGGSFSSEYSHEFQVLTPFGEDSVYFCPRKDFAQNREISQIKEGDSCPVCGEKVQQSKTIEVGNIFKLRDRYAAPMKLQFSDAADRRQNVLMGCYGLGPSRVMGAIAETHHDEKGLIWPQSVAPFDIHLLSLGREKEVKEAAEKLHQRLLNEDRAVLYDDRDESPGVKLAEADLLGIPWRVIVSAKTLQEKIVTLKKREEKKEERKNLEDFWRYVSKNI